MILKCIAQSNDKSINQILNENFNLSNRLFVKLLNLNKIFINGQNVDTRCFASIGNIITIDFNYDEDNSNIVPCEMKLDILYEDEGLLIINKLAGIAVHPSILHYTDSLSNGIKFYYDSIGLYKKIRPVNRLDLNTSGIIVFAKNEYVQENLIRQMSKGIFKKEYLALVEGHLDTKSGLIEAPIARKENSIIERCVSQDGKPAITEYEVLKEYENCSLIRCILHTGRTHQIRVHMAHIGHPLIGDSLYGNSCDKSSRHALHSYKISFLHPISNQPFELCSLCSFDEFLCQR